MMKRLLILSLALLLIVSLAACGGGNGAPAPSGDNAPLTRDDGSAPDSDVAAQNVDFGTIMGGAGNYTNLSPAEKQALIDAGKADGVEVTFNADGSVRFDDTETGDIIIQNPDGTWTVEGEDGFVGQFGGDWPDNEFTKLIPKPEFEMLAALTEGNEFTITFAGVNVEQVREYTEQVKAKGFTVNAEVQDQEVMGMVIFSYAAKNADGYEVEVFSASGMSGVTVRKP